MANEYRANKYRVDDSDLTAVADAIREKAGTTDPIAFPAGFVEAIAGISAGGDTDAEDGVITRTITEYTNPRVTSIGSAAFAYCPSLTTVDFQQATTIGASAFHKCSRLTTASFPQATTIGASAFAGCTRLTTVDFPQATTIGAMAFHNCSSLTTASFPQATTIGGSMFAFCYSLTTVSFPQATNIPTSMFAYCYSLTTVSFPLATDMAYYAFEYCRSLTTASFPQVTAIGSYAFISCTRLISLYLTGSSLCRLWNSNAFSSTPIGGYSASAGTYGSIYVPASLLTSYQTATNWTYFSSMFVAVE